MHSEQSDDQALEGARAEETETAESCLRRIRESLKAPNDAVLATELSIPYSTIASWRRRKSIPLETFIAVAKRTGASLDWLILGKDAGAPPPVLFNMNDAAFDYAVAFALVTRGIDVRKISDISDLVRTFYTIIDGTFEALDKKGLRSQQDRRAELDRQLSVLYAHKIR